MLRDDAQELERVIEQLKQLKGEADEIGRSKSSLRSAINLIQLETITKDLEEAVNSVKRSFEVIHELLTITAYLDAR